MCLLLLHHLVCYVLLVVFCCSLYPRQVQTRVKQVDKKDLEKKYTMNIKIEKLKKARKKITKVKNQKFMHCIFHKLSLTQESINCSITPPPLLQKPLRLPLPETVGQTVGASVDRLQPE